MRAVQCQTPRYTHRKAVFPSFAFYGLHRTAHSQNERAPVAHGVRAKAHDANADYQLVTTDTPLEPLLREFLTARIPKAKH